MTVEGSGSGSVWARFEHDPRDPAYAGMRASDRDRAVVQDVLAASYAEGRIDHDELDERTSAVDRAKTYAELLPPIADLSAEASSSAIVRAPAADVRRRAEGYYRDKVTEALFGVLVPNLICWAIWVFSGFGFPWPLFVLIPTGGNLLRVMANKQHTIESRVEKLQRREAAALEHRESD